MTRAIPTPAIRAFGLFVFLVLVYQLNGDFLPGNDAKPNVYLALSVLEDGDMTFSPSEEPFMFVWELTRGEQTVPIYPGSFEETFDGRSLAELRAAGRAHPAAEKYYIVPSLREGRYVSMYGPGAGLTALPAFAVVRWVVGDLDERPAVLWYTAKLAASMLVAGSAAFLFLALLPYTTAGRAAVLALAYGLGTGAWSTSSQALWQHAPDVFFLAAGTWLFLKRDSGSWSSALAGLAYACAVACRPNSALVIAAVGIYLLVADRRSALPFALGGAAPLALLATFNVTHFGSPVRFGQTLRGMAEAAAITGNPGVWQTPLVEGLGGHLVSPSRGLLVFSPFLAFALWGAIRAWRDERYAKLRPLSVAVAAILVLSAKWYYWWGGWSFGYRLIVDLALILTLLIVPIVESVFRRKPLLALFAATVTWSVAVQVVGAFAYDLRDWNARVDGYAVRVPGRPDVQVVPDRAAADRLSASAGGRIVGVVRLDVNAPEHRQRLWSWGDNQILYYLRHFREARRTKHDMMRRWLDDPGV